jgi:ATP/maltotriose-dependent transcriptional regulator MalT
MAEGEFALGRQHLEQALQKTTTAVTSSFDNASWAGDHDLYAMLADTAAQQRDEAGLRQYAPLAEESAVRYGHVLYQAIAHRAWGVAHQLAGEYSAAETRLTQALVLFQQLETRWQTGRTFANLGDLERERTNIVRARGYYAQALVLFEELQALPDIGRTRDAVAAIDRAGPSTALQPQRRPGGDIPALSTTVDNGPLTVREAEVLRLLAQGLTNVQIAETLVISPRTVNSHLRSIFNKLDVTTRTAAARYAAEFKLL